MPTQHVSPESDELLQEIADSLWKAKKVLVVTGAGISTNSGIPDFRSKNGLYSLIQAQLDAVEASSARNPKPEEKEEEPEEEEAIPEPPLPTLPFKAESDPAPPPKRRRLSPRSDHDNDRDLRRRSQGTEEEDSNANDTQDSCIVVDDGHTIHVAENFTRNEEEATIYCAPSKDASGDEQSIVVQLPSPVLKKDSCPSTPQRDGLSIVCGVAQHPASSSPLSSPPPILFDPEEEFRSGSTSSCRSSASSSADSDSESEADDETPCSSQPALSSQSSFTSMSSLPTMKGRDLFDASIWADPVKTSVFYTFATTLRQKIRDVTPTSSHQFISHLRDTGKLVRCYTQNIDEIEEKVGLSTSLMLGPGRKGRFSARSLSRQSTGLSTVSKDDITTPESESRGDESSQEPQASQESTNAKDPQDAAPSKAPVKQQDPAAMRGVECVFLHGSLRQLRCFRCGQTTSWDDDGREFETLSGRQPSCPRCEGATAAREGRGKRALAVGKLRPDIVLYGEEHPNAHLISPIVQHDISLAPDLLLILGTSLKVHGLKVLVREFSKAVHSKGGKVVFINFTKPPESVWCDIIDFWVQWDCDAWVQSMKDKKPALWLPPGSVTDEPKRKRKSLAGGSKCKRKSSEGTQKEEESTDGSKDSTKEVKEESSGASHPPTKMPEAEEDAAMSGVEQPEEIQEKGKEPTSVAPEKTKKPRKPRKSKSKDETAHTEAKADAEAEAKAEEKAEANAEVDIQSNVSKPADTDDHLDATKEPEASQSEEKSAVEAKPEKKARGRAAKADAKRPMAVRDDTANGAFVMWKIRQALDHISGRKPQGISERKIARATGRRKPRHSAPAGLGTTTMAPAATQQSETQDTHAVHAHPLSIVETVSSDGPSVQPPQNALRSSGEAGQTSLPMRTSTSVPVSALVDAPVIQSTAQPTATPSSTAPGDYSILSAVKANPRRRRSKKFFDGKEASPVGDHTNRKPKASQAAQAAQTENTAPQTAQAVQPAHAAPVRPRPKSMGALPPLEPASMPTSQQQQHPRRVGGRHRIAATEFYGIKPTSSAAVHYSRHASSAPVASAPSVPLPSIRQLFPDLPLRGNNQAFFFQDPLINQYGYPPPWPQEWSCGDQLRREADESSKSKLRRGLRHR